LKINEKCFKDTFLRYDDKPYLSWVSLLRRFFIDFHFFHLFLQDLYQSDFHFIFMVLTIIHSNGINTARAQKRNLILWKHHSPSRSNSPLQLTPRLSQWHSLVRTFHLYFRIIWMSCWIFWWNLSPHFFRYSMFRFLSTSLAFGVRFSDIKPSWHHWKKKMSNYRFLWLTLFLSFDETTKNVTLLPSQSILRNLSSIMYINKYSF